MRRRSDRFPEASVDLDANKVDAAVRVQLDGFLVSPVERVTGLSSRARVAGTGLSWTGRS